MLNGPLIRSVISEEDIVELTQSGFYKTPRIIKLRIVTDSKTGEQKYLLDHIKAMYID